MHLLLKTGRKHLRSKIRFLGIKLFFFFQISKAITFAKGETTLLLPYLKGGINASIFEKNT